ncbi:hypothetical protein FJ250_06020 [bacterium]|nr:hypothetical protein [bacterium]
MTDDNRSSRQVQVLKDLGLSRAESEVYLACLRLAAGGNGLLSSYRVAQDMGRDPANIGKIVNALVHLQAVRVVQEKPRLFVAVPPAEFTDHLLGRMRRRGTEAISLLDDFAPPEADGVALALGGHQQVLARARALIAGAKADLLVAGSPEVVRELGADLELAAAHPGCRVRVVSPQAFTSAVVEVSALPTTGRVGRGPEEGWLALAVDDVRWLVALLPHEASPVSGPSGWWAAASPLARVWAEFLETSWRAGVSARPSEPEAQVQVQAQVPAPEPAGDASAEAACPPAPAGVPDFVPGAVAAPAPAAGPPPDALARPIPPDAAEQAGFAFLYKHDRRPDGASR